MLQVSLSVLISMARCRTVVMLIGSKSKGLEIKSSEC